MRGDTSLVTEGHNEAPEVTLTSPAPDTRIFVGETVALSADASDPEGSPVRLIYSSSLEGPTEGTLTRAGRHVLVVLAVDAEGGTDTDRVEVEVVDPDRDGDGFWAVAWGGEDCRDDHPGIHPEAEDACDGADQDCDGLVDEGAVVQTWYADSDNDTFGDPAESMETCFFPQGWSLDATDCDDADPTIRHCTDCEQLKGSVFDEGDGVYAIEPTPGDRFDVWCDQTAYGGGWTQIGTADGDIYDWTPFELLGDTPFGDVLSEDMSFKSPAWVRMPFTDLLFAGSDMAAEYKGVGDGTTSLYAFMLTVPFDNCGPGWPMTDGTLAHNNLCSTKLYIHAQDLDGSSTCTPGSIRTRYSNSALGPTWSDGGNHGCPLDDPFGLFRSAAYFGGPLRVYAR